MGLFRKAINDGVSEGVSSAMKGAVPNIVDSVLEALWKSPYYSVIAGGQLRLIEAGVAPQEAWKISCECLAQFLRGEKIKFGDDRYDWSFRAGITLVEEYEIEYWDALASQDGRE